MKIQEDNFRKLLTESLGFERKADEVHDILYKYYEDIDVELSVNFTEEKQVFLKETYIFGFFITLFTDFLYLCNCILPSAASMSFE